MEKRRSGNRVFPAKFSGLMLIALLALLGSCAKDGGVCVSNSGPIIRQTRDIAGFNQIVLNDNVSLILTTDSVQSLVVEAGTNLLGGIGTKVENGLLTISNSNSCNWLRDYSKPINVYLSMQNVWKIEYNASGDISTTGSLKLDSLTVEVWGGCGTIDMSLNIFKGNFSLNMGTANFKLRGLSAITSVYVKDYGFFDGRDLETGYTFITSNGSNDCYVRVSASLEATIGSIGNIYYTGDPPKVKENIVGAGKLIRF